MYVAEMAEQTTTFVSGESSWISGRISRPPMSGICRSSSTMSGLCSRPGPWRSRASPASPDDLELGRVESDPQDEAHLLVVVDDDHAHGAGIAQRLDGRLGLRGLDHADLRLHRLLVGGLTTKQLHYSSAPQMTRPGNRAMAGKFAQQLWKLSGMHSTSGAFSWCGRHSCRHHPAAPPGTHPPAPTCRPDHTSDPPSTPRKAQTDVSQFGADKFTTRSREAIEAAQLSATTGGNSQTDPLHLLVALLRQEDGITRSLITKSGLDPGPWFSRDGPRPPMAALPSATGATVQQPARLPGTDPGAGLGAGPGRLHEGRVRRHRAPAGRAGQR